MPDSLDSKSERAPLSSQVNKKQWGIGHVECVMIPEAVAEEAQEAVATSPPKDAPNLSTAKLEAVEVRAIHRESVCECECVCERERERERERESVCVR